MGVEKERARRRKEKGEIEEVGIVCSQIEPLSWAKIKFAGTGVVLL